MAPTPTAWNWDPSDAILRGDGADVYWHRTIEVLRAAGRDPEVAMEVFASREGVLCGMQEVRALLDRVLPPGGEVWALAEGDPIQRREVVLRIVAPYLSFALYETAYLGMLAHQSGWATAARACTDAAGVIPVVIFGSRFVHPNVAHVMEYAAQVGGCAGASNVLGARMFERQPTGTMPHALALVVGDVTEATLLFDKTVDRAVRRVALVDTFHDEAEEAVRVAQALGQRLAAVRLDTPKERGGVTPELVHEVRAHLDQHGFTHVGIFVSGGLSPERIQDFVEARCPVVGFGVGSYIAGARPLDFTADIHQVDGANIAKRGRIPGITPNPRLRRVR